MSIYALKVDDGWAWLVHEWLKNGDGRFGWSYVETADLHELRNRIASGGWNSLDEEEKDCYYEPLLSLDCGDYVVYVNVPEWGRCTLAQATGKYFWRWADNDFNHRFPVDQDSVHSFETNDAMVPIALRARLKLRARCYRINAEDEFVGLLESLRHGGVPAPAISGDNLPGLTTEMKPVPATVMQKIRHLHGHGDLENLVEQVLRRVPGVRAVTRRGGTGSGADFVVDFELGSIPQLAQTLVVQVRSDPDTLTGPSAVGVVRGAFGAYDADMVLIVCAATNRDPEVESRLDRLREDTMKPLALLTGEELAAFLWRHGSDLLTG